MQRHLGFHHNAMTERWLEAKYIKGPAILRLCKVQGLSGFMQILTRHPVRHAVKDAFIHTVDPLTHLVQGSSHDMWHMARSFWTNVEQEITSFCYHRHQLLQQRYRGCILIGPCLMIEATGNANSVQSIASHIYI